MRIRLLFIALVLYLFTIQSVSSQPVCAKASCEFLLEPVPMKQFTPEAKLWLATGAVLESGLIRWESGYKRENREKEQIAIAFTLANRWKRRVKRVLDYRFITMITGYCVGLKKYRTPRQRLIHKLNLSGEKPKGWPKNADFDTYNKRWQRTLDLLDEWSLGLHEDPFHGKSYDWEGRKFIKNNKKLKGQRPLRENRYHKFGNVFYGKMRRIK